MHSIRLKRSPKGWKLCISTLQSNMPRIGEGSWMGLWMLNGTNGWKPHTHTHTQGMQAGRRTRKNPYRFNRGRITGPGNRFFPPRPLRAEGDHMYPEDKLCEHMLTFWLMGKMCFRKCWYVTVCIRLYVHLRAVGEPRRAWLVRN